MDFRPLLEKERNDLWAALRGNAQEGMAILTSRADTSFAGAADEVPDGEVITAIQSIPTHY